MTRAGVPESTDLTDEQRARLEALNEAKRLVERYREPVPIDDLQRVAVFILDGAQSMTLEVAEEPRWADRIGPDPFLKTEDVDPAWPAISPDTDALSLRIRDSDTFVEFRRHEPDADD